MEANIIDGFSGDSLVHGGLWCEYLWALLTS